MCGLQNLPCTERIPHVLLTLLPWLKIPFLQSSGQVPLTPSQSCYPPAQPDLKCNCTDRTHPTELGLSPGPALLFATQIKRDIFLFLLQRVGLELRVFAPQRQKSKASYLQSGQMYQGREWLQNNLHVAWRERFYLPSFAEQLLPLCSPVLAESSGLWKEFMWEQ